MNASTPESVAAGSPLPFGKDIEVFFDGDCPLCRREIAMLQRKDRLQRIRFTDITLPDFDPASTGLSHEELMQEIHGRIPDGSIIHGVEVFRRLYTAIGWKPLVALTRFPGVRQLLDIGYRIFAKNRLRLTGRCGDGNCALPRS